MPYKSLYDMLCVADHVANTYFYEFDYDPSFMAPYRPPWHSGLDHGIDLFFTLGTAMMEDAVVDGVTVSEADIAMSKLAIQYWTNFIKTG